MDGHRFDDLTRALAGEASRRRVLGSFAGGLAAALGVGRPTRAEPIPCVPGGPCGRTADCCPTERCVDGRCVGVPGGPEASCAATGCPPSTVPCRANVCNRAGQCELVADPAQEGAACEFPYQPDPGACRPAGACDAAGACVTQDAVTCPAGERCCEGACTGPEGDSSFACCPPGSRTGAERSGACCSALAQCTGNPGDPTVECECVCNPAGFPCSAFPRQCCSGACVPAAGTVAGVCACSPPGGYCDALFGGNYGVSECCSGTCVPVRPGSRAGTCQ